ncbi:MAG TPA: PilZ domain-containing protein [Kofleriaceae bacterium]|nr:PilZ domain-containing protein [Kofleriaceae bacterium]
MKHRRHRRVEAKGVAAHIDAEAADDDFAIENISVGGLFIRTSTAMPIGMPVRVDLLKPGSKTGGVLSLQGRVVSVVSEREAAKQDIAPGVGIEFDAMSIELEKRLHALLRDLGLKDLAEPTAIDPDSLYATASPDTQQVAANVRGLLEMLTEALQKVKERDDEITKLKAEVRRLTTELRTVKK